MDSRVRTGAMLAFALAVALAVGWLVLAVDRQVERVALVAQGVSQLRQAAEAVTAEVVDLPNDGKAYYTTLLLHDDWLQRPAERALVAAFQADPLLASTKAQTHWNVYTASNPLYAQRFARSVPVVPALLIQDSDGKVHLKLSGDALTGDVEKVRGPIRRLWQARPIYVLPWRRPAPCPCPEPTPSPQPEPEPEPVPDTPIPDTLPPAEPFPWWLLIVAVLVGFAAPFAGYAKRVLYGDE